MSPCFFAQSLNSFRLFHGWFFWVTLSMGVPAARPPGGKSLLRTSVGVGQERGTVTGRARRCGWLDAAALKRSIIIKGVSGLCITKLVVLDGLSEIRVCPGYTPA